MHAIDKGVNREPWGVTMNDLDDAIIEDTVHCTLCGASWVLGGCADGVIVTRFHEAAVTPEPMGGCMGQIKLCVECALQVRREIDLLLQEADVCEHGVQCGDWCQPCNEEYKLANIANG